jgi:uncharacterized protein
MSAIAIPSIEELEALPLIDQPVTRQFEIHVGDKRARLEYDRQGDRIFLTHTAVPPALEGHHVGDVLVHKVLQWVADNNLKLIPTCPFVKAYLRRNPEWKRLLLKGLHV